MWRVYHFECYQCQSPYTRTAKKHKINKQTSKQPPCQQNESGSRETGSRFPRGRAYILCLAAQGCSSSFSRSRSSYFPISCSLLSCIPDCWQTAQSDWSGRKGASRIGNQGKSRFRKIKGAFMQSSRILWSSWDNPHFILIHFKWTDIFFFVSFVHANTTDWVKS